MTNGNQTVRTVPYATIVFHGNLSVFGEIKTRPSSVLDMLRVAFIRNPELRAVFQKHDYKIYLQRVDESQELDYAELNLHIPSGRIIHVVPYATGNKSKGASIGKIIAGAVITVGAFALAPSAGGLAAVAFGSELGMGITYGAIAAFGVMTMLGGVASLIGSTSTASKSSASDSSTTLSGTFNNIKQGGCIPLVYGKKIRVGSSVASLGYSVQEWSNSDNTTDNESGLITTASDVGQKGKGGGSSAHETPNNARSKAVVNIIDIVAQGPGVLPYGATSIDDEAGIAKSIYLNGTPLMASDGTWNFNGVKFAWRTGEEDQDPVPGFPASEATTQVNTEVRKNAPVVQTVSSATADSARVILQFPALYKADSSSGVLGVGPDLNFVIEVRESGGPWFQVVDDTLKGLKFISPYERMYKFDLPNTSGPDRATSWDVRVTRNSVNADSAQVADTSTFLYVDVITDHKIMYSGSAYCALSFDSALFGTSVPERTYDICGKEVRVPANYDPTERTFATTGTGTSAGTWDGITWKTVAACDDPAWCILDILSDNDFGFNIPESKLSTLEADLYEISQYAAGKVDDGYGGSEFRYMLNVGITEAGDAYKVLSQFCSTVRALTYFSGGMVSISADMPRNPVMLVTNANVVDGNFSYEGTAATGRHNTCYGSFINQNTSIPFEDIEVYSDPTDLASRGEIGTDLEVFGCTSRGLARRFGHWLVDTELHQTETVTYQCGIDHAAVRPGEVVEIADHWYMGSRQGGRVRSGATVTVIPLDVEVDHMVGLSYVLKTIAPDGSVQVGSVSSIATETAEDGSTYSVVTLEQSTQFTTAPAANSIWTISEPTRFNLRQFRVLAIKEQGDGVYQVIAIFHDPAKFDRVEKNLQFNEKKYSTLPDLIPSALPAPTNVTVQDYTVGSGSTTIINVDVGWTAPTDVRVLGCQIRAVNTDTAYQYMYDAAGAQIYEIQNLPSGNWTFGVRSYGKNGSYSVWVDTQSININGSPVTPPVVTGLTVQGGTRLESLTWNATTIRNPLHYEIQRAADSDGVAGVYSTIGHVFGTAWTDTDSVTLKPLTTWWYRIRVVDTYGTLGPWSDGVYAQTNNLLVDDFGQAFANTAKVAQAVLKDIGTPQAVEGTVLPDVANYEPGSYIDLNGRIYQKVNNQWQDVIGFIHSQTASVAQSLLAGIGQPTVVTGDSLPDPATYPDLSIISWNNVLYQKKSSAWAKLAGTVTLDNNGGLTPDQITEVKAASISGQLTDEQIKEVDAAKLAGVVVPAQLAQATSNNLIWDGCGQSVSGWQTVGAVETAIKAAGDEFGLGGDGSLSVTLQATGAAPVAIGVVWKPLNTMGFAVVPGTILETQVLVCASSANCSAFCFVSFYDATGTLIQGYDNQPVIDVPNSPSARLITNYKQLVTLHQEVPAGSVYGTLTVSFVGAAETTFYMSRALVGTTLANTTTPMSWVNGSSPLVQSSDIVGDLPTSLTVKASQIDGKLTSEQIDQLDAAKITGQITETQIGDDSISTAKIQASAVVSASIAASSITAEKLAVGSPSSVIWNPSATSTTDGWQWSCVSKATGSAFNPFTVTRESPNSVNGEGGLFGMIGAANAITANTELSFSWNPNGDVTQSMGVTPGQRVFFSAYVIGGNGATQTVTLQFYDKTGTLLKTPVNVCKSNESTATESYQLTDLDDLSKYIRLGFICNAPENASSVIGSLIIAGGGTANPWTQFCKAMSGYLSANVVDLPEYSPGGVTSISGGVLTANSVLADRIVSKSITSEQISASAITAKELAAEAITANHIQAASITGNLIAANTITGDLIQAGTINATHIQSASIGTEQLAASSITSDQIASNAITASKIAAQSITAGKLAAGSVIAGNLAAGAITADSIAAGSITTRHLATGSITTDTIRANAITTAKIAVGAITARLLSVGSVTADAIAANAITAAKIQSGAIGTDQLAAGAVTTETLAANSVTSEKIIAGAVQAAQIQAGAIGADQLAAGSITAEKLAVEELIVDTAQIGNLVVGTRSIVDQAVTTFLSGSWTTELDASRDVLDAGSVTFTEVDIRVGFVLFFFELDHTGGNMHYNISLSHNGQLLYNREGMTAINDHAVISVPLVSVVGSNTISATFQAWGGVNCKNRNIIVLTREK